MFHIDPEKIAWPKGPIKHFKTKWLIVFSTLGCFAVLDSSAGFEVKASAVVATIGVWLWARMQGVFKD